MKVREIAELIGGELVGNGDIEITGIAELTAAKSGDIAFYTKATFDSETNASCVFVPLDCDVGPALSVIRVANPKLAFSRIASKINRPNQRRGWHGSSIISTNANVNASFIGAFVSIGDDSLVGESSEIHDGTKIGRNVTIGTGTIIHPNCVICDGAVIGSNCVIRAGVVIGADGFGYVPNDSGEHIKFPQVGTVVIEDDVEIGANSCIDRGSLGETRVGEGTKIDNLVQIAHNVQIGKRCIIAALSGISGSSVLEDEVVLAGQVGIADHVVLKSGVTIGAKSAVFPNKIVSAGVWCGVPVQRIDDYKRQHAILKSVGRLKDQVRDLARKVDSNNASE